MLFYFAELMLEQYKQQNRRVLMSLAGRKSEMGIVVQYIIYRGL